MTNVNRAMPTTTNFEEWLEGANMDDNWREVRSVYECARNYTSDGYCSVLPVEGRDGCFIIKIAGYEIALFLASDYARRAFLRHMSHKYGGNTKDIDFYFIQMEAKEKSD